MSVEGSRFPRVHSVPVEMDRPSNCLGYAFYSLGIIPEEGYVDPWIIEIEKYFDAAEGPHDADAVGAVYKIPRRDGSGEISHLSHIAVVDKLHPEYVYERSYRGAAVTRVKIQDTFGPLLTDPYEKHELVYLKRPIKKS
jgi:hypothetical protein